MCILIGCREREKKMGNLGRRVVGESVTRTSATQVCRKVRHVLSMSRLGSSRRYRVVARPGTGRVAERGDGPSRGVPSKRVPLLAHLVRRRRGSSTARSLVLQPRQLVLRVAVVKRQVAISSNRSGRDRSPEDGRDAGWLVEVKAVVRGRDLALSVSEMRCSLLGQGDDGLVLTILVAVARSRSFRLDGREEKNCKGGGRRQLVSQALKEQGGRCAHPRRSRGHPFRSRIDRSNRACSLVYRGR